MSALLERVEDFVRTEFSVRLPPTLTYHSLEHTELVVGNCILLAREAQLKESEMARLLVAAWMHDIGLTTQYDGHEESSCAIASRFLRSESILETDIENILGCIRATRIPQDPKSLIEQVLCDADLLYLGTDSYLHWAGRLRIELGNVYQRTFSNQEWVEYQLNFLRSFHYHTPYAIRTFGPKLEMLILDLSASITQRPMSLK